LEILGTLQNLAEVGVAITGFAGIVAAVAYSTSGSLSDADRRSFTALVLWSLGATFLAYVPVILFSLGDRVSEPWRLANAIFAAFHGYVFFQTLKSMRAHPDDLTPFVVFLLTAGFLVFAAEIAAAAGPLASIAPSVYLIAVIWFLFIAVTRFVNLVSTHLGSPAA